ncbi:hypothetical protein [Paenibacillus sp. 1P07SE]|uniref:hypothetical protein n=1 Tax=Paenibacillus sp. 1P07SE TaxID=3132209 RepID=UPI0039A6C769
MKVMRYILLLSLICIALSGCGGEPAVPIDPAAVEASLSTEPAVPVAEAPVTMRATFSGAEITDKADVTLDIRLDDKPMLVNTTYDGEGGFTAGYNFEEPGSYEVFIHLYVDDLHLTKKAQVDVQ